MQITSLDTFFFVPLYLCAFVSLPFPFPFPVFLRASVFSFSSETGGW